MIFCLIGQHVLQRRRRDPVNQQDSIVRSGGPQQVGEEAEPIAEAEAVGRRLRVAPHAWLARVHQVAQAAVVAKGAAAEKAATVAVEKAEVAMEQAEAAVEKADVAAEKAATVAVEKAEAAVEKAEAVAVE